MGKYDALMAEVDDDEITKKYGDLMSEVADEPMDIPQPEPAKKTGLGSLFEKGGTFLKNTAVGAVQHPIQTVKGLGYGAAKSIAGLATDFASAGNQDENEDVNMTMPGRFPVRSADTGETSQSIVNRKTELADMAVKPITENLTPQEARGSRLGEILAPAGVVDVALGGPIGKIAERTLGGVVKGLKPISKIDKLDKAIELGVSKGIKPTVIGKPSLAKLDGFYDKANDAVKTIAEHKNLIKIVNNAGEEVSHPKTVGEFAQAIDQSKKILYKKYHDMSLQAGDAGAQFSTSKVVNNLKKVSSPENLKLNPQVRDYAASLIKEIEELEGAAPEVVEERIKDLNTSLAGFYDGRVTKAKAQVDASVAQLMREELDNKITSAVGEGYQGLKNQYGSLKAIEREVNKRALVNARQAPKGLTDLTDIFTGGEIISGVLSMNPALIAKGVAGRGIKEVYKKLNNPDRYIEKMFKQAYGLADDAPLSPSNMLEGGSLPVSPKGPNTPTSDNLEIPTFQRKGRSPLPEQPLETGWNSPNMPETKQSAFVQNLLEDVKRSEKKRPDIEGIDNTYPKDASFMADQLSFKRKTPITQNPLPSDFNRSDLKKLFAESVDALSNKSSNKDVRFPQRGKSLDKSDFVKPEGKFIVQDIENMFKELSKDEQDVFIRKIEALTEKGGGARKEVNPKLMTSKELGMLFTNSLTGKYK
jgi:hypothetical protein